MTVRKEDGHKQGEKTNARPDSGADTMGEDVVVVAAAALPVATAEVMARLSQ